MFKPATRQPFTFANNFYTKSSKRTPDFKKVLKRQQTTNWIIMKRFITKTMLTLWGAFNRRWICGSWVTNGMLSLKTNDGGLDGSGKLVLLNGSVSSRNWTLHSNTIANNLSSFQNVKYRISVSQCQCDSFSAPFFQSNYKSNTTVAHAYITK